MKRTLYIILMLFFITQSCSDLSENRPDLRDLNQRTSDPVDEEPTASTESDQSFQKERSVLDSFELDTEPPYKYPCACSFQYVGVVRVSESRWDEIQLGKGWDGRRHSCSFTWGEHINNNFPPDSTITDFRMHLVDLDSADILLTPEFLNSKLFKDHLIVTSINGVNSLTTKWDPNRTGKYVKPKQWME